MDLYASKGALNARLLPIVDRLAARGVAPDHVTLAAIPVAVAGGACILAAPTVPVALLAVPLLATLRLVLNLLDGALARRTGRAHPRGELLNELGDRVADIALLAPVAALPGADPVVVLAGVLAALLASYVGVVARAAAGERIHRGILSKPGRMVLLAACSTWALLAGRDGPSPWGAFGVLLLAGGLLTLAERIAVAIRRLP